MLAGVEEGMFPNNMTNDEPGRMEEERRLCYVGMTRAMKKLVITYAESRRLYGQDKFHTASRFIREIPKECLHEVRLRSTVSRPVSARFSQAPVSDNGTNNLHLGDLVSHPKFGEGTILNYEGDGQQARVQVQFDSVGSKWLVLSFARLTKV